MKPMNRLMRSPRNISIEVTDKCNLRCPYCFHFSGTEKLREDLPSEEWIKFFEELKECAVMNVTLSGGEPFYRDDLMDIVDGLVRNNMRYQICSNGTLITEEMAKFLSSTNRCNHVQISIDGSTSEIHDRCRGHGTFNRILDSLSYLKQNRVKTTARMTINKYNVFDLENTIKFLLEDIGMPAISVNFAQYEGLCRENASQILLTPEERSLAMEVFLRLDRKYKGRIWAQVGPLRQARDWQRIENARLNGLSEIANGGNLSPCPGVMRDLMVRADGIMIPCSQLSHIELGRINRDSLLDVWQNHIELKKLRERNRIPLESFQFCQSCEYIKYCNGGCPVDSYNRLGDEYHPSPDECLKRFLGAGGRLPLQIP